MCEKNKKPQETIELTDDQLEQASGGADGETIMMYCSNCKRTVLHEWRRENVWSCTVCGNERSPLLIHVMRPGRNSEEETN